ncbi:MAG TPA: hypothetical protein VJH94_00370 [Candidatus Paceibacterota bacterium]|uniref:Uncharacterized protein n=1 Tax=Candidatus Zambryskibacteria bacterium RIFCSPHIGHO2_01_FULL_49_18 TaxID=1802740 RepID=A0A1G2T5F2_9BACT|nr:MAG: hypothetical protein A2758_03290 [Candidatus Zambryskibacteria bacterium RIFCSPHIGHO2_01_FULL_49_18]
MAPHKKSVDLASLNEVKELSKHGSSRSFGRVRLLKVVLPGHDNAFAVGNFVKLSILRVE